MERINNTGSFGYTSYNEKNVYSYDLRNLKKEHKKNKKKKIIIKKLKKFFCGIAFKVLGAVVDVAKEAAMAYVKHKLAIA